MLFTTPHNTEHEVNIQQALRQHNYDGEMTGLSYDGHPAHLRRVCRCGLAMWVASHDAMHSHPLLAPVSRHRQGKVGGPEGHCLLLPQGCLPLLL